MNPLYHDAIERRLTVPLHEGPDKTTTLAEAIRRHVHAGDTVYLGSAHGRPNPLVRELVLQWWGKSPAFPLRLLAGADLQVGPALRRFEATSADELALVRLFDPRRYFLSP